MCGVNQSNALKLKSNDICQHVNCSFPSMHAPFLNNTSRVV